MAAVTRVSRRGPPPLAERPTEKVVTLLRSKGPQNVDEVFQALRPAGFRSRKYTRRILQNLVQIRRVFVHPVKNDLTKTYTYRINVRKEPAVLASITATVQRNIAAKRAADLLKQEALLQKRLQNRAVKDAKYAASLARRKKVPKTALTGASIAAAFANATGKSPSSPPGQA